MRWTRVAFVTIIPLLAIQPAHAQSGISDPLCEFACWMSPSDAPASCGCKTAGDKPMTEPPATPRPRPSPAPAPATPTVSNCPVMCEKNPLTAPEACDCAVLKGGSGTGAAGGAVPAVTPESIVEDGFISVAELLDYMIQLYRSRIAGVQRYQFLEKKVVGQSEPLARNGSEPRVIPVANSQLAQKKPVMGVDTMIPGMYFLEKVMREGHEAFKVLTPPEKNARRADTLKAPSRARAGEVEAAREVMKDPALFFEALGLKGTAKDMRDQFEKEKNDEDLFAEDVLEELLALKNAYDAEATKAVLAKDAKEGAGKAQQAKQNSKPGSYVSIGWVRKGTLKFTQATTDCKSPLGCTSQEILSPLPKDFEDNPNNWLDQNIVCLVWSPQSSTFALAKFGFRPGISSKQMSAQLWLPIPAKVLITDSFISSDEDIDRPIRAVVGFTTTVASKFMLWDRVYGDFRNIGKGNGDGPAMNVPHRIREQLRSAPCSGSVDPFYVMDLFTGRIERPDTDMYMVLEGEGSASANCAAVLGAFIGVNYGKKSLEKAVVDRIRRKYVVNRLLPSPEEEAGMIYEEFGCIGQPSDDPSSPCR